MNDTDELIFKLWIENELGEGGDFCINKFYKFIDKFFKENY